MGTIYQSMPVSLLVRKYKLESHKLTANLPMGKIHV